MNASSTKTDTVLIALIWSALLAAAIFLRPLLPIDETRYITVAWEMWKSGDYWVPTLNGELYSHKPPLYFWLMNLGWAIFGVSETWARMVAPLFGLGTLWLTAKLARELWPDASAEIRDTRAMMAPLMMLTGLYWTVFATMTMFDMIVTFAAVLAILGYVKAWKGFATGEGFWLGLLIAGLGMGLGGLAKGPAILVHTLPVALFAPLWGPATSHGRGEAGWGKWYGGVLVSVLVGVGVTLAWAVPAALIGGEEYRNAIFIKQSADRMVKSFAHRRPFYWFLWVVPLMVLPWTLWPRLWRAVGARTAWTEKRGLRAAWANGSVRILLIWAGAAFVIFSAISGKQPHYLLPIFPALALFAAYVLSPNTIHEQTPCKGHRVPALVLGVIALILLVGLLAQDVISPLLKKPLPDWVHVAEPLWLIPVVILAFAAALSKTNGPRAEVRLIAALAASVIVMVHMTAAPAFSLAYDLEPAAQRVKAWQDQDRPVAYIGKYHGEFQFLGRLNRPVVTLQTMVDGQAWAAANPTGVLIATLRKSDLAPYGKPITVQPYRGKVLAMWDATGF